MPRDELRQPLRRRSLGERLWARRPSALMLATLSLCAVFLGTGVWLAVAPQPRAGEPVVVVPIPPVEEQLSTSSLSLADDETADAATADEEVKDDLADPPDEQGEAMPEEPEPALRGSGGEALQAYESEPAIIVAPNRPLKRAPIAEVTEKTKDGPLPRVSSRGRKPFDAYSQVTPLAVVSSARPKIVLVLGGMGLNASLTKKAIAELPGDVTLGFAPYGENLQAQVNAARAQGHEILLQVPMEPMGYPGSNPGPRTLLSDATPQENLDALRWHMSRFAGYSGITNYMGARLLSAEEALKPVMGEVKKRGLVYLEDATANPTLSPKVAGAARLPIQRANILIDAEPTAPAIREALERLEQEAARTGLAIGTGAGLAVTIETVAEWAKTLQERGMLLVPVSAAYKGRQS